MNVDVIYVTRSGDPGEREDDPLLRRLNPMVCADVEAALGKPLAAVVQEIRSASLKSKKLDHKCIVVISAFLDREKEGVKEGSVWDPEHLRLKQLVSRDDLEMQWGKSKQMRSIRLVRSLWELLREYAKIFVTTDGVAITRRAERALETAVSAGQICQIYNWRSNPLFIEDLIMEATRIEACR